MSPSVTFSGDSSDANRATQAIIEQLEKLSRQALQTSAVMKASLGQMGDQVSDLGDNVRRTTVEHDRHTAALITSHHHVGRLTGAMARLNLAFRFAANLMAVLKWPAMVAAIGLAVQAVNALAAGITALVSSMGPLLGLVAAAPAGIGLLVGSLVTAKLAFNDLGKAMGGNKEALKNLTPEARDFAKHLMGLKPVLQGLREEAQRGLFPGLEQALRYIAQPSVVGVAGDALRQFGQAMGFTAEQLAKFVARQDVLDDLRNFVSANTSNMRRLAPAWVNFADALRNVMMAAQPLVNYITSLVVRLSEWAQGATEAGRRTGALGDFFAATRKAMEQWGRVLGGFGEALINVLKAAAPLGDVLMEKLGGVADGVATLTGSVAGKNRLADWFKAAQAPLVELGRLVGDLLGAFAGLVATPAFTKVVRQLRTELLPVLEQILHNITEGFGPALLDLATQLLRILSPLVGPNGPLTMLAETLADVARWVADIVQNHPAFRNFIGTLFGVVAVLKVIGGFKLASALVTQFTQARIAAAAFQTQAIAGNAAVGASTVALGATIRAALISTGIGAVIVAVGMAVAFIITHWDKLDDYWRGFAAMMKTVWRNAWQYIVAMVELAVAQILLPIELMLRGLKAAVGWIPGIGDAMASGIQKGIDAISFFRRDALGRLTSAGQEAIDAWSNALNDTTGAAAAGAAQANAFANAFNTGLQAVGTTGPGAGWTGPGAKQPVGPVAKGDVAGAVVAATRSFGPGGREAGTYVWGAIQPGVAFDCSGMVAAAYARAGIQLPHNARAQYLDRRGVNVTGQERPGDAVFFDTGDGEQPGHVGIYVGGDRFIEYNIPGQGPHISKLSTHGGYMGARRWYKVKTGTGAGRVAQPPPAATYEPPELPVGTLPSAATTKTTTTPKVDFMPDWATPIEQWSKTQQERITKALRQGIISKATAAKLRSDLDAFWDLFRSLSKGGWTKGEKIQILDAWEDFAKKRDKILGEATQTRLHAQVKKMASDMQAALAEYRQAFKDGFIDALALHKIELQFAAWERLRKKFMQDGVLTEKERKQLADMAKPFKEGLNGIREAISDNAFLVARAMTDFQKALKGGLTASEIENALSIFSQLKGKIATRITGMLTELQDVRRRLGEVWGRVAEQATAMLSDLHQAQTDAFEKYAGGVTRAFDAYADRMNREFDDYADRVGKEFEAAAERATKEYDAYAERTREQFETSAEVAGKNFDAAAERASDEFEKYAARVRDELQVTVTFAGISFQLKRGTLTPAEALQKALGDYSGYAGMRKAGQEAAGRVSAGERAAIQAAAAARAGIMEQLRGAEADVATAVASGTGLEAAQAAKQKLMEALFRFDENRVRNMTDEQRAYWESVIAEQAYWLDQMAANERAVADKRLADAEDALEKRLEAEREAMEKRLEAEREAMEKQLEAERRAMDERLEAQREALERSQQAERESMERRLEDARRSMQAQLDEERRGMEEQLEQERRALAKRQAYEMMMFQERLRLIQEGVANGTITQEQGLKDLQALFEEYKMPVADATKLLTKEMVKEFGWGHQEMMRMITQIINKLIALKEYMDKTPREFSATIKTTYVSEYIGGTEPSGHPPAQGATISWVPAENQYLSASARRRAQEMGFAMGGIVHAAAGRIIQPSVYVPSDRLVARVSPGEMILSPSQQQTLFKMVNGEIPQQRGGAGDVIVNVRGSVISERDLAETVRRTLYRTKRQAGGLRLD